jgi:hypothetical protein
MPRDCRPGGSLAVIRRQIMGLAANFSGVVALAAGFAIASNYGQAPERFKPLPVPVHDSSAPRITYPANHLGVRLFPDGQRREVRSVLNIRSPMHFGEYRWNDSAIAAGQNRVRIDLARQTLSVFRAGHEIGSAVILYGTDGKPTPSGVFPVLAKAKTHRSTLHDARMPFMLRLTEDGAAIHASDVREGAATHGCIGVPPEFARRLFDQLHIGDRVAIIAA